MDAERKETHVSHGSQGSQGGLWHDQRATQRHLTTIQTHMVAALSEFVGTFMFLYVAYAGNLMVVDHADPKLPGTKTSQSAVFISLMYGFSLLVNVWAFYRISGGLFNPALTLGLSLSGNLPWLRTIFIVPAQLLASICAGALVSAMFRGGSGIVEVNTTLAADTTIAQGCFIEMFLTAELVFVVLMLASEKSKCTFLAPIGIGLALFVVMIPAVPYTGASVNPARSFGCAVAATSFPGYHWIYWVGPGLGALLGAAFYLLLKYLHYEEVNVGQDSSGDDREKV